MYCLTVQYKNQAIYNRNVLNVGYRVQTTVCQFS